MGGIVLFVLLVWITLLLICVVRRLNIVAQLLAQQNALQAAASDSSAAGPLPVGKAVV